MFAVDKTNPWIAAARDAPRQFPAWAVLVAAVACADLAVRIHSLPVPGLDALSAAVAPEGPWQTAFNDLGGYFGIYTPLLLAPMVGLTLEGRGAWRSGSRPRFWLGAGLVLGAAGIALSLAIAYLGGAVVRGSAPAPGLALWGPLALNTAAILLGVGVEELYFRSWLQPRLAARWGPWAGLIVASIFFAALHVMVSTRSPMAVLNTFLAGMLFGLLALRTGGLIAPCAAHFAWNWCETNLFGCDSNPGSGLFGAFFDLDLRGPPLWSGGGDTMNGSLATTLVLGAMILGLSFLGRDSFKWKPVEAPVTP